MIYKQVFAVNRPVTPDFAISNSGVRKDYNYMYVIYNRSAKEPIVAGNYSRMSCRNELSDTGSISNGGA